MLPKKKKDRGITGSVKPVGRMRTNIWGK